MTHQIQINRDCPRFLFSLRGGGVGGGDARKMQENFLVFAHASPRACPRRISFLVGILGKIHSNFVQQTPLLEN